MEMFKVCRVCLATNVTLYNLHSDSLEFYYELLTGMNPLLKLNLPMFACFECTALLKKFFLFRQKCLRGQAVLQGLLQQYGMITEGYIKNIDRERFLLTSSLSICDEPFKIKVKSDLNNVNTNIEDSIMKEEADPTDDKLELGYEQNYDILEEWLSDDEFLSSKEDSEALQELVLEDPTELEIQLQQPKKPRMKAQLSKLVTSMNVPNEIVENVNIDKHFTKVILTKEEQRADFEKRRESSSYQTAPFSCKLCYKPFLFEKTLQNHAIKHNNMVSGRYECDICKLHFKYRHILNAHIATHTTKYLCKSCPVVLKRLEQVKKHVLWHKGVKYKCPYCGDMRSKWTSYLSHVRIKHPSDHICALCGYSFVSQLGLTQHKAITHKDVNKEIEANSEAPYCEDCDVRFASEEAHRRHLLTAKRHAQENPKLGCRECVVTFASEAEKRAHRHKFRRPNRINVNDSGVLPWPINCPHCSEELSSLRSCTWHFKRKHPNEKFPVARDFICEVCGMAFVTKLMLVHHTRRQHDTRGPATCPTCGKTFACRARLDVHKLRHTAVRTSVCEVCGKALNDKGALNRHMEIHTGERRFKCEECGKAFTQSTSCKLHYRAVHLGEGWPRRIRKRTKDSVKAHTSRTKDSVKASTSRTKDSVKAHTSRIKAVTCPSPDSSPGGSSSNASTSISS